MNSDLMPSPESPNSNASQGAEQTTTSPEVEKNVATSAQNNAAEPVAESETKSETKSDNVPEDQQNPEQVEDDVSRMQPIPPPSEPMQYRAIGLVRGRYQQSSEQFTQGTLLTTDNAELDAVLLGRIMSLVKNHLDLEKDHLWVVYPRTRQENDKLHVQIVGVWEPENLAKPDSDGSEDQDPPQDESTDSTNTPDDPSSESQDSSEEEKTEASKNDIAAANSSSEILDGNFSIRGEIVYQSNDANNLVVKIKQAPRKPSDKPKYFKLKILGKLEGKAVGKFWDLEVKREADNLMVEKGQAIADLPRKRKPRKPGGYNKFRKPFKKGGGGSPRPFKKEGSSPVSSRPNPGRPTPKPVKREKPPEKS